MCVRSIDFIDVSKMFLLYCRTVPLLEQEVPTLPEHLGSPSVLVGFVFCVVYCRLLFVVWSFFFWPLHSLSFFDLRILITLLVSSNSSYGMVYIFILQSVHLLYKHAMRINICFIRTRRINFSYYTNTLFSLWINFPGTL